MREADIQKKITDYIEGLGGYVVKVIKASKAGTPDLVACIDGMFYGFEVKTPTGKASKLQEYHLKKIAQSGGISSIVRSVEDIKEIMGPSVES